jgi:hypothetical protein
MTGGTISGNTAQNTAGGVFVDGTATLQGGTLTSNTAAAGGAVRVSGGTLTLSGADLTNNSATNGGALYISDMGSELGAVTITAGEISANSADINGNGIYVSDNDELTLAPSGEEAISFAESDDIYLPGDVSFNLTAPLDTGAPDGIYLTFALPTIGDVVAVSTNAIATASLDYLIPTNAGVALEVTGDNIAIAATR